MDKLKVLFAFLFIGFFVAGCAQPEVEPEVEPEPEPEPEVEVQPEPEPEPEMSDELKEILANNEKVTSFEYRYSGPGEKQITYHVKGNLMRGSYASKREYEKFIYYRIYLNLKDETAYLVCDDIDECKVKKALTANYDEFAPPDTPLDVVRKIQYAEITERTQLDNKNTAVVSYVNEDGNQEKMWIWEYWGMPLKREVSVGGTKDTYEYDGLVINSVTDGDVTMPIDVELT